MHRGPDRRRLAAGLAIAVALLIVGRRPERPVARRGRRTARPRGAGSSTATAAAIAIGQRMIVVLKNPSLADRMAEAGGTATESAMRQWTAGRPGGAEADRGAALARGHPARAGLRLHAHVQRLRGADRRTRARAARARPGRARRLSGSGRLSGLALGGGAARAARSRPAAGGARRSASRGFDGSGITVALLDTGVDVTHPFIRDRLLDGLDMLDPERRGIARAHPDEPTRLERHGTQLAGLIAGRGGPGGIHGVAPARRILPIRVAGWQPSAEGGFAVYGRTDQLLAGLERAVDPGRRRRRARRRAGRGRRRHRAVRLLPGRARSRAPSQGAARLDTLVVVPAGNEGPAGPSYGSIGGPGGAPGRAHRRRGGPPPARRRRSGWSCGRGCSVLLDREVAARRRRRAARRR